ncbi:IS110 family transposase [Nonomuraea wenchangensis]|uniref:IS110 family transposase n=1 Tax=Nonomuraea wenchangensis TaxID=568860 RepID=UPI0033EEB96F
MGEVQEIPDEGHEKLIEHVAAIDVAKANGKVCTRTPASSGPGRRLTRVWEVAATVNAITELGDHLICQGIAKVTVESTGDYWRIWYYVLEARGLAVQLVNARDVKNLPGRPKTDKLDAVWLAKLTEKGLLRPSFVPPAPIRALRDYTRLRIDLSHERTRHWQRMEKLLEDALIKLSVVVSKLTTVSARQIIEALIAGQRDPHALAELAQGRLRLKSGELIEALTGRFDDHHGELAAVLLIQIDGLDTQIAHLTARIEQLLADATDATNGEGGDGGEGGARDEQLMTTAGRLDEIPGISPQIAQVIIAEIGLDMTRFATAGHLVSWAKLCPRTIQSGARSHGGKTGKGNPYLKGVLGIAATAAAKSDTFLGARYRRIVKRRGKLKALVAVGRSILVIIWHLLADPTARYRDLGSDYHTRTLDRDRKTRDYVRQLQALGFAVTLTPTS